MNTTKIALCSLLALALASSASAATRCWCEPAGSASTIRGRDATLSCARTAGPGGIPRAYCDISDITPSTLRRSGETAGSQAVVSFIGDIDTEAFTACCSAYGMDTKCDDYACAVCRCTGSPACSYIKRTNCPSGCRGGCS